jgi:hypothetical protein
MKKNLTIAVFLLIGVTAFCQNSVNTSGGDAMNNSGSISYSIGQVAYQNIANSSGSVNQGIQQVFIITTLGLEETKFNFSLTTYPNPAQEQLNLRIRNYQQEKLSYTLLDSQGKKIAHGEISSQETILDMQQLQAATYFVEVQHADKKVQSFKIVKN